MKAIIADLPKTAVEIVRVELSEHQGKTLIAIRVWTRSNPLRSIPIGLTASVKMVPAITALNEVETWARRQGLLDG